MSGKNPSLSFAYPASLASRRASVPGKLCAEWKEGGRNKVSVGDARPLLWERQSLTVLSQARILNNRSISLCHKLKIPSYTYDRAGPNLGSATLHVCLLLIPALSEQRRMLCFQMELKPNAFLMQSFSLFLKPSALLSAQTYWFYLKTFN